ncbi:MAG: MmgE/PrpD family protein, partial [Candidatus Paceibacteria bacterium]
SMGGLKAALLADAGFEGNRTIFDGKKGFWRMAASDQFEPDIISEVTSDEWAITDVSFKPYSSCRWSHAALDCLSQLKTQINDRDVASISIDTFYEATTLDGIPNTILDAQFSLPYVVAVHLLDYPTGYEWLQRERITDSQVLDLAKRVSLNQDEEMTANYEATGQMQAKMTIELTDGSILSASVDHPRGTPENPIQYKSIEKKYETLVEPIIGHEPASELKRHVLNIEQHDLTSITQLMNGIKSPARFVIINYC